LARLWRPAPSALPRRRRPRRWAMRATKPWLVQMLKWPSRMRRPGGEARRAALAGGRVGPTVVNGRFRRAMSEFEEADAERLRQGDDIAPDGRLHCSQRKRSRRRRRAVRLLMGELAAAATSTSRRNWHEDDAGGLVGNGFSSSARAHAAARRSDGRDGQAPDVWRRWPAFTMLGWRLRRRRRSVR
jgi:hypothetical protein